MKRVLRVGRDVKVKKLRDMDLIERGLMGADLDVKVGLIQSLIPLGLRCVHEQLQAEVERLCGQRYQRERVRGRVRWASQRGSIYLADQKVPLQRPRIRDLRTNREMELPLYQRLQEPGGYDERVYRQLLHGMTCRRYQESSALVPEAFGLSAGQVSKRFIRVSSKYLSQLQTRSLAAYDFIALFLDGKTFQKDELVMGLGITMEGKKVLLGFVQTGTENTEVCRTFLEGLVERGFQSEQGLLCVIDGSKGLRKAVVAVFGAQVLIQRCQWHKRENVVRHLSKDAQVDYRRKLQAAYEQPTYEKVKQALLRIRRELTTINLSAVESLEEGLEETLTLHRLGVFPQVGISFKTANCMESIMSQVEQKTNKVDNWRNSDQKQRWVATSLLDLEKRLHKVKRHKYLTLLRAALQKELKIVITQKEAA